MADEMMQEQQNMSIQPTPEEAPKKRRFTAWWHDLKRWEKVLTVVLSILVLFLFYVTLDANKYQAVVQVVDGEGKVGVNPTTERLDFGDLSRGTSAVRTVTVKNGTFMPMYVVAVKTGDISDLMDIDTNYFRLTSGKEQRIELQTYIPASAVVDKKYSGRVYLFKIPTFGL